MAWAASVTIILASVIVRYGVVNRRERRSAEMDRRCSVAKFDFRLQRERLEAEFIRIVKNRPGEGCWLWDRARFGEYATFARHRYTGELTAYLDVEVETTLSGIQTNAAQDDRRKYATIVFQFHDDRWSTSGMTILNTTSSETVRSYQRELELIEIPEADWEEAVVS